MKPTGDIPDRDDIEPPAALDGVAVAKVKTVAEALDTGGTIHAYLISGDGVNDEHFYSFNTHCFPDKGWIFKHGEDKDMWIPGDDLGMLERHYE